MVTVQIGDGPVMKQSEISEGWIDQQINRRRQDDQAVCVKVTIKSSTVDMLLVTSDCPTIHQSRQVPTAVQKRIWDSGSGICGLLTP
jgi:hypothetical protein